MRILGVGGDARSPRSKWRPLYDALATRFEVVEIVQPPLRRFERGLIFARHVHRDPRTWRARARFSPAMFRERTRAIERELANRDNSYDVIVQSQTLFAPGTSFTKRNYVIYADATRALNEAYPYPGAPATERTQRERKQYEADVAQHAARVFTMSEWARKSFIDDYGCAPENVVATGWGARIFLERLDLRRPVPRTALFVGGNFVRKGGEVLLSAWRKVRRQLPDAKLIVAGPREAYADAPGVEWHGRIEDSQKLAQLYLSASIFVLPTLWEPYGLVFEEAMGQGLPVVATDVCAVGERVHHNSHGLLVPPNDVDALAESLVFLLRNEREAAVMGEKAHRWVLANATWPNVLDRIAPHLADVAAGSHA